MGAEGDDIARKLLVCGLLPRVLHPTRAQFCAGMPALHPVCVPLAPSLLASATERALSGSHFVPHSCRRAPVYKPPLCDTRAAHAAVG